MADFHSLPNCKEIGSEVPLTSVNFMNLHQIAPAHIKTNAVMQNTSSKMESCCLRKARKKSDDQDLWMGSGAKAADKTMMRL